MTTFSEIINGHIVENVDYKRQRECVHSPMSGIIKRTANFISRKDKRDDKDRKVERKYLSVLCF